MIKNTKGNTYLIPMLFTVLLVVGVILAFFPGQLNDLIKRSETELSINKVIPDKIKNFVAADNPLPEDVRTYADDFIYNVFSEQTKRSLPSKGGFFTIPFKETEEDFIIGLEYLAGEYIIYATPIDASFSSGDFSSLLKESRYYSADIFEKDAPNMNALLKDKKIVVIDLEEEYATAYFLHLVTGLDHDDVRSFFGSKGINTAFTTLEKEYSDLDSLLDANIVEQVSISTVKKPQVFYSKNKKYLSSSKVARLEKSILFYRYKDYVVFMPSQDFSGVSIIKSKLRYNGYVDNSLPGELDKLNLITQIK